MDNNVAAELLSWNDVLKIVVGFFFSALLIWIGVVVRTNKRKMVLKRSVWNVLKNQTSFDEWMAAMDAMCQAAEDGNAYNISFDVSLPLSRLISELASIDPLKSDIYINLLSKEEVVRRGLRKLGELQMELAKSRTDGVDWSSENISLRKMISGQCCALKKDVIYMYEAQLELMKYIQIKRSDAIDSVGELEKALNKQGQSDA